MERILNELLLYIKAEGYDVDVLTAVIERLGNNTIMNRLRERWGLFTNI